MTYEKINKLYGLGQTKSRPCNYMINDDLGADIRYWNDCDRRFGDDWPGRIPAQLFAPKNNPKPAYLAAFFS